ncbi:MAG: 4-hydroxybenzoate octaprenyltransferase, partial [Pseudomonadota bacterium]
ALARWDRPVGIWLLLLPCWMGLAQMRIPAGFQWIDILWIPLFAIGAIAMRGAGCTWNDIQDRDIDAQVARTSARPLPSGDVTLQQAYVFLGAQVAVGFLVWLCLPNDAKIVALLSIPLVAAYPYMKRITWWPQAWLGFTFNFGALVGAATATSVTGATVVLYLGLVCWTVAYDTIYALQDREDDAMLGVKSTARLFGDKVLTGIFVFHLIATALIFLGAYFAGAGRIGALLALAFLGHGIWQVSTLSKQREARALGVFKSNIYAGVIVLVGLVLAAFL